MGAKLSANSTAGQYLNPRSISNLVQSNQQDEPCCWSRLFNPSNQPVQEPPALFVEPELGPVHPEDDIALEDYPPQVLDTLHDIFESLCAHNGTRGHLSRAAIEAYCSRLEIPLEHVRSHVRSNQLVKAAMEQQLEGERDDLKLLPSKSAVPEDALSEDEFLALWKPSILHLSTVDSTEIYECCAELRRLSFSAQLQQRDALQSAAQFPPALLEVLQQIFSQLACPSSRTAFEQDQLAKLGFSSKASTQFESCDEFLALCVPFVNLWPVHQLEALEACCTLLGKLLDTLRAGPLLQLPSEAANRSQARSLRLAIQQGSSLAARRKQLDTAFENLQLKEQQQQQLSAVHREALANPEAPAFLAQLSARATSLHKKRDATAKALRKLHQENKDEIENNMRRFLISIGVQQQHSAAGRASVARVQLGSLPAAAHKQALEFTTGELTRLNSKLTRLEQYSRSLEEEATGAPVPPLSSSSLLLARDKIQACMAQAGEQINQHSKLTVQPCPLGASEEETQWHLLRLQLICLLATKAEFRVAQDKQPNHDALSTTALKSHELGTKWTKLEVDNLLSKLHLVQADVEQVCAELQKMSSLFSDSCPMSFDDLCQGFKDCVVELQHRKKSGKLNKLEGQLKELSSLVAAEEMRLASMTPEQVQGVVLQLEQRIRQLEKENVEQRAFLEKSASQLLTYKEEALLKSLPQLKEQLRKLEKKIKAEQLARGEVESDDETRKRKPKKQPSFQIHDAVAIWE